MKLKARTLVLSFFLLNMAMPASAYTANTYDTNVCDAEQDASKGNPCDESYYNPDCLYEITTSYISYAFGVMGAVEFYWKPIEKIMAWRKRISEGYKFCKEKFSNSRKTTPNADSGNSHDLTDTFTKERMAQNKKGLTHPNTHGTMILPGPDCTHPSVSFSIQPRQSERQRQLDPIQQLAEDDQIRLAEAISLLQEKREELERLQNQLQAQMDQMKLLRQGGVRRQAEGMALLKTIKISQKRLIALLGSETSVGEYASAILAVHELNHNLGLPNDENSPSYQAYKQSQGAKKFLSELNIFLNQQAHWLLSKIY